MKTLVTLGLLTLICFLRHTSANPAAVQMLLRPECCANYNRTAIPRDRVKHVAMTPPGCRPSALIVTAVSGRKFCVDPAWRWAVKLLAGFQKSPDAFSKVRESQRVSGV